MIANIQILWALSESVDLNSWGENLGGRPDPADLICLNEEGVRLSGGAG
jgi:hypothetical protein